ncbi:MAG: hypothetical protein Q8N63_08730 [Nanoarchaeota archaeon]|nr:hypothetical protein [Nanoarchaeota archaeon]
MNIYGFILDNRELFKFIFTAVIGIICLSIVIKTNRLFKLSLHQGLRYFRNAFFFYGLAFIARYFLGTSPFLSILGSNYYLSMNLIFEFFLMMAGFSLLYSLLWKRFEPEKESFSSLLNLKVFIFYLIALTIGLLDIIWNTRFFMFAIQIILFFYASLISYGNYVRNEKKQGFSRLYFFIMLLNFVAWVLNFIIAIIFDWNQTGMMIIYSIISLIFLLFFYSVMRATRKSKI